MSTDALDRLLAPKAITNRWLDFVLVGGLSIVLGIPLFFMTTDSPWFYGRQLEGLSLLVNIPHFMASYVLLYASWQRIKRHQIAAIWMPIGLLITATVALSLADVTPVPIMGMYAIAGVYTAWHYAGQTWGMMATYGHLSGKPFDDTERRLVRWGLIVLTCWHATHWLAHSRTDWAPPWYAELITTLSDAAVVLALVGVVLGCWALVRYRRRVGQLPDLRALVSWFALLLWYALMARFPAAVFWAQYSHALQYLAFPGRVVVNRARRQGRPVFAWSAVIAVAIVLSGYIVFRMVPAGLITFVKSVDGPLGAAEAMPMMVTIFVNVHHYFTDGAIWKLRNPDVQRDLFAHIDRSTV